MADDVAAKFYLVLLKELQAVTARREDTPSDAGPFSDDPASPWSEQKVWERAEAAARKARQEALGKRAWEQLKDQDREPVRRKEEEALRAAWQQGWDRAEEEAVGRAVAAAAAKDRQQARYQSLAKAQAQAEAAYQAIARLFHVSARAAGRGLREDEEEVLEGLRKRLASEVQRLAARRGAEKATRAAEPGPVAQAAAAYRQMSDLFQKAGRQLGPDEEKVLEQLRQRCDAEVGRDRVKEVRAWEEKKKQRAQLKAERARWADEADKLHRKRAAVKENDEEQRKAVEQEEEAFLKKAEEAALDMELVGLALSGGGIRSATFNLGVLQGLASLGLLKRFDYLSTVSGGGYIGSWLAAWIKREGGVRHVEQQLHEARWEQAQGRVAGPGGGPGGGRPPTVYEEEPEPVFHLRSYSNYLAPRPGLFSADTWVGASVYLRNLLLNLLLILPAVVAVLLLARLALVFYYWNGNPSRWPGPWPHAAAGGLGLVGSAQGQGPLLAASAVAAARPEDCSGVSGFLHCLWRLAPAHAALALVVAGALVWASFYIFRSLSHLRSLPPRPDRRPAAGGEAPESPSLQAGVRKLHANVLLPLGVAAFLFCWFAWMNPDPAGWPWYEGPLYFASPYKRAAAAFAVLGGLLFGSLHLLWSLIYWLLSLREGRAASLGGAPTRWWWVLGGAIAGLFSGAAGGAVLGVLLQLAYGRLAGKDMAEEARETAAVLTLGPPVVLLVFALGAFAQVGVLGRYLEEDAREWWASLCGRVLLVALAWAAVFALALFSVPLLIWAGPLVRAGLGTGWVVTAVGGAVAGRSPKTDGKRPNRPLEVLAQAAPYVFLVGLLAAASFALSACLDTRPPEAAVAGLAAPSKEPTEPPTRVRKVTLGAPPAPTIETRTQEYVEQPDKEKVARLRYWAGVLNTKDNATAEGLQGPNKAECLPHLGQLGVWLGACLALWLFASWRVDVNLFSMHGTYGNRLVRCYLGASRCKQEEAGDRPLGVRPNSAPPLRRPNPITGFDLDDDFPLHDLVIGPAVPFGGRVDLPARRRPYWGPYPLVNTAMNLLEGDELAWQERKAEAFVLTPVHCGSKGTGFRALPDYGENLTLGTAATVSGAAASPNMGYHSSPAVTALLTVFNVRLGAWFGNPRQGRWRDQGPLLSGVQLLKELFGRTNRRSGYVYLSDGGHFENLGVYELVRRRCRFVVVVDAGQDGRYDFDDLGGLARKCRSDLGVPIDVDVTSIRPRGADGRSQWHCAIGKIRYDSVHPEALPGTLVYLKASLTGDEPSDVLNYASLHPDFPHQTTANQFFTESQFESYRALGYHVAREVFWEALAGVGATAEMGTEAHRRVALDLFANLHRRWFPPPPQFEESFLKSVRGYVDLMVGFREDEDLHRYSESLYPELTGGAAAKERVAELHATSQMLQVMENAWLGVHLEGYYAHPMNRGWMNLFRRWTSSEVFRRHWLLLRGEYSWDFVRFCEKELKLDPGVPQAVAADPTALYGQPAWQALEDEFGWEWPLVHPAQGAGENSLRYLVRQARDLRLVLDGRDEPAIWLVRLALRTDPPAARWGPDHYPIGIVLVWRPPDSATDYELVVWLRGAYRNLAIGRACLGDLFVRIKEGLAALPRRREWLRARFPGAGRPGSTDTLQKEMWLRFFNRHGVRRRSRPHEPAGADLILEIALAT
jgi:predicted acylesterase/phospholipase RssA